MRKRHYFIGITVLIGITVIGLFVEKQIKKKLVDKAYIEHVNSILSENNRFARHPETIPWDTISESRVRGLHLYTDADTQKIKILTMRMEKRGVRPSILTDRAEVYNNMGKYDSALADVDRAIRLSPNESNSHSVRMQIMINLKDTIEANRSLNEFKRSSTDLDYEQLALYELNLLHLDSALVHLERDFQSQWKSAEPYDTLRISQFKSRIVSLKPQFAYTNIPEPYKSKWENDFARLYQKYWSLIPEGMRK